MPGPESQPCEGPQLGWQSVSGMQDAPNSDCTARKDPGERLPVTGRLQEQGEHEVMSQLGDGPCKFSSTTKNSLQAGTPLPMRWDLAPFLPSAPL